MASKAISKEKPIIPEKSREEIEAERKLRKALKAAKKVKAGTKDGAMNSETENTNDLSIKNMTSCVKNKANDAIKIDSGTDSVDGERILGKVSAVTTLPGIQMISVSKISSEKVENNTNGLSKSQLKAQRRELQEAQRAAKHTQGLLLKSKQDKENNSSGQEKSVEKLQPALSTEEKKAMPKLDLTTRTVEKTKKKVKFSALSLFSHLPIIEKDPKLAVKAFELCRIHQSFYKFGQDCANGLIRGGNARAIGLLTCLKLLIRSCELSAENDFSRNLLSRIELNFRLVEQHRPASISMMNCLRVIKTKCLQLGEKNIPSNELKEELIDAIDSYIDTDIKKAIDGIAESICKATDSSFKEVYMTFGFSSTVFQVFKKMKMIGRVFHVVIVESALRSEGKEMMKRLARLDIPCTLVFSKDISFMMKYVKMVFLGSSALLVNSDVLARAGTSQVALTAKSFNVPVLACCETYKCTNRAQTDAFSLNERGSPCQLVDLNESSNIDGLNLIYDITPNSFLTAIVTEIGIFPAGAAKAILRLKQLDTDE